MKRSVLFSGGDENEKNYENKNEKKHENESDGNLSRKEFNTDKVEKDSPGKHAGLSVIEYLNLSRYTYIYM
jgi:hypothetical protein